VLGVSTASVDGSIDDTVAENRAAITNLTGSLITTVTFTRARRGPWYRSRTQRRQLGQASGHSRLLVGTSLVLRF